MLKTIQAEYLHGQVLLTNKVNIPDNTPIFISYIDDSNDDYFLKASESSLDVIWNNNEDDIYEQLLKK